MKLSDLFLTEFDPEMATARTTLERIPEDKLSWKPHEKSMPLNRLAGHIAELAGWPQLSASVRPHCTSVASIATSTLPSNGIEKTHPVPGRQSSRIISRIRFVRSATNWTRSASAARTSSAESRSWRLMRPGGASTLKRCISRF